MRGSIRSDRSPAPQCGLVARLCHPADRASLRCASASSGAAVASKRSSVVPGTLCRPLRCKGRCRKPAPTEAVGPLHRTACMPSCSSGLPLRIGTMAGNFLSRAFSVTQTHSGRLPADLLLGAARPLLARARPSARRSRSSHYLQPLACAHLSPRSAPPSMTPDVRSLVDRSAPARTCTTRPRRKADRVHVVHRPDAQGKKMRRSLLGRSLARPAAAFQAAEGGAAAAVARALARLRSFLPLPCLTVPRRAGAEIRPHTSPHKAHAPSLPTAGRHATLAGQMHRPAHAAQQQAAKCAAYCCAAWFAC